MHTHTQTHVQLLEAYENEHYFQMVMEKHGDGLDLFEFIEKNPQLTEPLISFMFRQVREGGKRSGREGRGREGGKRSGREGRGQGGREGGKKSGREGRGQGGKRSGKEGGREDPQLTEPLII